MSVARKKVRSVSESQSNRLRLVHSESQRAHVVRQDRISPKNSQFTVEINGRTLSVANYNSFGVALFDEFPFEGNRQNSEVILKLGEHSVGKAHLRFVREEQLNEHQFKAAFEVIGDPIELDRVHAAQTAQSIAEQILGESEKYIAVPKEFKSKTLELKELLKSLQLELEKVEEKISTFISVNSTEAFVESLCVSLAAFIRGTFDQEVQALAKTLKDKDEFAVKQSYDFFRKKLAEFIYQSPFSERSLNKPLGYAGDFEMMNMLYRNENLGRQLFAKSMHRYIIEMPGGNAVRNRADYLEAILREKIKSATSANPAKILSVASGPAMELQRILSDQTLSLKHVEIHLLDQDLQSLKYAQRRLRELSQLREEKPKIRYHNRTIKEVISNGAGHEEFSLVYSAGLFDYFSDSVAVAAARSLFKALKENGELIIGNFAVTSPSRFFMELAWDWYLIYRSEADLKRLFGCLEGKIKVEKENEGVNLFCRVKKNR